MTDAAATGLGRRVDLLAQSSGSRQAGAPGVELNVDGLALPDYSRDLERYLDLAACEGEERVRAEGMAPRPYVAELGWYLLEKR